MGGSPPPVSETSREMLQALADYAPAAIQAISATTPGTAQQALDVQRLTAPGYAALQNQITRDYGPEAARIGSEIERANQLAAAETEANILTGPAGQALISGADVAQRQLDPEFYRTRATVANALDDYLGSYSPTELTPGEIEQISRGISAREGPVTPSNLRTIRNAQTFGDATTRRWQNFGDAVLKASSALPALRSGLTGFEIATRRPLISNVGSARLSSPESVDATTAFNTNFGFANTALNNIGNLANTRLGMHKDTLDKIIQGTEAFKNVASGVGSFFGCWVAREVFGNDSYEWVLFRAWLISYAPNWFRKLYEKYGERFAGWLKGHAYLKPSIKFWMRGRINNYIERINTYAKCG